jgi:class 3 adenylate cyclase
LQFLRRSGETPAGPRSRTDRRPAAKGGCANDRVSRAAAGVLKELVYRFQLDLESSPERLWPLVSDTNRFNRDAGVPAVERRGVGRNARRRLRLSKLGVPIEWEEEPFEWISPHRFSVGRRYLAGPVDWMKTTLELVPRSGGGTRLEYEVRARARNLLGRIAIPVQIGLVSRRRFSEVFRRYDASSLETLPPPSAPPRAATGAGGRMEASRQALVAAGRAPELVDPLCSFVEHGDDLGVSRIRPYELADLWGVERREVLGICLEATRHGLLELRWELLCPLCRGAAAVESSLGEVSGPHHCETCLIDVTADFERSVEITFRPSPAIRKVEAVDFCVAGPQVTPHVVAQQLLPPGGSRRLALRLEPGRYRLRALAVTGALAVLVAPGGATDADAGPGPTGWPADELRLAGEASLRLENETGEERLLVLERTAWSDQAATASGVTSLQVFRDLFATQALRPGEPISVGSLTVVFTDLRGSTRYYREVGDAPAFGSVLDHLDVLRAIVAQEDGAVVKAMGDAIMAVFARPVCAVRAMLAAQQAVAGQPLALKVGIHYGPCIAVDQNGVLDYFGSTVNLAARLVGISSGDDIVVSDAVLADPEVAALAPAAEPVDGTLKGFEDEAPPVWRLRS